jgi:riboflavin transporter FmnP
MHIPVLISGLLLGWKYGLLVGVVTPIISSLMTNMPVMWPVLPSMVVELGIYGAITGILRVKYKSPLYVGMISAMIVGRIIGGLVLTLAIAGANFLPPLQLFQAVIATISTNLATGVPGIIIQLAFVPVLVKLIERAFQGLNMNIIPSQEDMVIQKAIGYIESGECGCVLIKNNIIIHKGTGRGVRPLYELATSKEGLAKLEGAIVVDKIIGKAAAMLVSYGKVSFVYGLTMSKSGQDYLKTKGIPTKHNRWIGVVTDWTGEGICPMENCVMAIEDPQEGLKAIGETMTFLRSKSS